MSVGSELLDKLEVYGNDRMEVLDMIEYVNILLNEKLF